MEKFWSTCLSRFEQELSAQQFNTWIKPLKMEVVDNTVRLLAPNKFVQQWVKDRFLSKIAVSYTHLDVYKRQTRFCGKENMCFTSFFHNFCRFIHGIYFIMHPNFSDFLRQAR